MRNKANAKLWLSTGGILLAGFAPVAQAQLAITGNLGTTAVTYPAPRREPGRWRRRPSTPVSATTPLIRAT